MNNDLISRSALKEAFEDLFYNDVDDQERTERLIDNAPTVEAKTTYDVNRAYDKGFITAMKAYARPKGEWEDSHIYSCGKILKGRNDVIEHKCSVCKRWSIKWDGTIPDNFCSHCGADMRGGANEVQR